MKPQRAVSHFNIWVDYNCITQQICFFFSSLHLIFINKTTSKSINNMYDAVGYLYGRINVLICCKIYLDLLKSNKLVVFNNSANMLLSQREIFPTKKKQKLIASSLVETFSRDFSNQIGCTTWPIYFPIWGPVFHLVFKVRRQIEQQWNKQPMRKDKSEFEMIVSNKIVVALFDKLAIGCCIVTSLLIAVHICNWIYWIDDILVIL